MGRRNNPLRKSQRRCGSDHSPGVASSMSAFSALGTSAIGAMIVARQDVSAHSNFGKASQSDEENIQRIWQLAFNQPLQQIAA